jgi:hypothetical protein
MHTLTLQVDGQEAISQSGCAEKIKWKKRMQGGLVIYLAKHRTRSNTALGIVQSEAAICFGLHCDTLLSRQWQLGHVRPRYVKSIRALHPGAQRAPGVRLIKAAQVALIGTRSPKIQAGF